MKQERTFDKDGFAARITNVANEILFIIIVVAAVAYVVVRREEISALELGVLAIVLAGGSLSLISSTKARKRANAFLNDPEGFLSDIKAQIPNNLELAMRSLLDVSESASVEAHALLAPGGRVSEKFTDLVLECRFLKEQACGHHPVNIQRAALPSVEEITCDGSASLTHLLETIRHSEADLIHLSLQTYEIPLVARIEVLAEFVADPRTRLIFINEGSLLASKAFLTSAIAAVLNTDAQIGTDCDKLLSALWELAEDRPDIEYDDAFKTPFGFHIQKFWIS